MGKKLTKAEKHLQHVWGGLPRRVKVGHGWWTFQFEQDLEAVRDGRTRLLYGETDTAKTEIVLNLGQSFAQARDTVMHELMHAISSNTLLGCHSNRKINAAISDDEGIARMYTPFLLMLIQDNPELIEWLRKEEGEDD